MRPILHLPMRPILSLPMHILHPQASSVEWVSLLMSMVLGLLALTLVCSTFWMLRTWSLWLFGQARGKGFVSVFVSVLVLFCLAPAPSKPCITLSDVNGSRCGWFPDYCLPLCLAPLLSWWWLSGGAGPLWRQGGALSLLCCVCFP